MPPCAFKLMSIGTATAWHPTLKCDSDKQKTHIKADASAYSRLTLSSNYYSWNLMTEGGRDSIARL